MAQNDYLFAKDCMATGKLVGNYNVVASLCAQSGEKFLKAIIEKDFINDADVFSFLRSHNLRALYNKIISKRNLTVDSRSCKWLGDFYYDARYPGDNFIIVNEQDALECLEIVAKIKADAETALNEGIAEKDAAMATLKKLKAF